MSFGFSALAVLLVAACGHRSMAVLVPDPDGSVGRITVANAAGSVEIDKANESTIVSSAQTAPAPPAPVEPKQIQNLFGGVMSRQPLMPVHFILHFESDSVRLLPDSSRLIPKIVSEIQRRMPTRVSVVGHTDTMGDKAYNVALSRRRAEAVKRLLVNQGVDGATIDVSSHGEENPIVKTADNVANAMNRRVEVVVR